MQGDVAFCNVLQQMGCAVTVDAHGMTVSGEGSLRGIDVDMNAISDTVQTLAVVALFADGPTRVRGVAHNRFKETDRIGDLARELRKLGATVKEHADGLTIGPPAQIRPAVLETYEDHRMAMSLSLAGLAADGIRILDPACTAKTYPDFFADLERLTGRPHRWGEA
jgi:3-phosphoshikimate 1-carboxyvinyltransferase